MDGNLIVNIIVKFYQLEKNILCLMNIRRIYCI